MVLAASSTVPKPPGSLGDAGREVWGRLWVAGQAWLSVETDRDVLTRLCEAHDERDAMREQIALDGFMVPGSRGQLRPHPLLTHLRALETPMNRCRGTGAICIIGSRFTVSPQVRVHNSVTRRSGARFPAQ